MGWRFVKIQRNLLERLEKKTKLVKNYDFYEHFRL
jgi:hypothetical protein